MISPLRKRTAAATLTSAGLLFASWFAVRAEAQTCLQCGPDSQSPTLTISPASASLTGPGLTGSQAITIDICDNVSVNAGSLSVQANGVDVSGQFTVVPVSGSPGCTVARRGLGTITLAIGTTSLQVSVNDGVGNPGFASASYVFTSTATFGLEVHAALDTVRVPGGQRAAARFTVKNTGSVADTVDLVSLCVIGATGCASNRTWVALPPGGTSDVAMTFTAPAAGQGGVIRLTAQLRGGTYPYVWEAQPVKGVAGGSQGLANDVRLGVARDRGACLMLPAGLDAVYECAGLRLAHSASVTRLRNTAYAPALTYNHEHAEVQPILARDVTLAAALPGDSVIVVVRFNGSAADTVRRAFPVWPVAEVRRLGIAFASNHRETGVYGYRWEARLKSQATPFDTASGNLAVVNRRSSPFGSGWWVGGVESLKELGDGTLLWVGGDGSTNRYVPVPGMAHTWVPELSAGPDTLKRPNTSATLYYARHLPGGVRVWFDQMGRHTRTQNSIGLYSDYVWNGTGQLTEVRLPRTATFNPNQAYTFEYNHAGGRLSRIVAPGNRPLAVGNTGGTVTSFTDPDGTSVTFAYAAGTHRVLSRTDRRKAVSVWAYANGLLSSATVKDSAQAVQRVETYGPQEVLGIAAPSPAAAWHTWYDGPRTDVQDRFSAQINRWGAPRWLQDADGSRTWVDREDPRFPTHPTRVRYPNGRETSSLYDGAGRPVSSTDWSWQANGRYATTLYEYDPKWGQVTRVTAPDGEEQRSAYHAVTGQRLWSQPGNDSTRRVTFQYYPLTGSSAPGLVSAVVQPVDGVILRTEGYEYDTRGNLSAVVSPQGRRTEYRNDQTGRIHSVRSPIASGLVAVDTVMAFDAGDRPVRTETIGPAMNGVGAQRVVVETEYDPEGLPLAVRRWSVPDSAAIGPITSRWRYDASRRPRAEVAPQAPGQPEAKDSTVYDPAGNPVQVYTRRGHRIDLAYDRMNRLTARTVPGDTFAARREGIALAYGPSVGTCSTLVPALERTYPSTPNGAGCSLVIPPSVTTFAYDTVTGALLSADNADVRVSRTYHPNGLLASETQRVRDVAGTGFTNHVYHLEYEYDLGGRRTAVKHPAQLAPSPSQNRTSYEYDPLTGAPSAVIDALGNRYGYAYGNDGSLASLRRPGGITDTLGYDLDGRLSTLVTPGVRSYVFSQDWRGKIVQVIGAGPSDTLRFTYSGLGHLVSSAVVRGGNLSIPLHRGTETFAYDGLANGRGSATTNVAPAYDGSTQVAVTSLGGAQSTFGPGVGTLLASTRWSRRPYGDVSDTRDITRTDRWEYNAAGDQDFSSQVYQPSGSCDSQSKAEADCADAVWYHAPDGVVRAVERRTRSGTDGFGRWEAVFEEYRYDAFGRRAWVRTRRSCGGGSRIGGPMSCQSTIRRTVWDGNLELYEIQMPGEETSQYLENDTARIPIRPFDSWWVMIGGQPQPLPQNFFEWDPNPHFGRVAYTHGLGVDAPLGLVRIHLQQSLQAQNPQDPDVPVSYAPFAMSLLWDWRGQHDGSRSMSGATNHCETISGSSRCVVVGGGSGDWSALDLGVPVTMWAGWNGTLLSGKLDGTGAYYRRARYYDPQTGRFTQEDPIGIAGGLNLYGFGGGDPVNFADPSGNIPVPLITGLVGAGIGAAIGGYKYGWKGAVAGGVAGGLVGAGLGVVGVSAGVLPAAVLEGGAAAGAGGSVGPIVMTLGRAGPATTSVAAAAAAAGKGGSHIVLGYRHAILHWAPRLGGTHLMHFKDWEARFVRALETPGTRFTFVLDDIAGTSVHSRVMGLLNTEISRPGGVATAWEMMQFYQRGRMGELTFVLNGVIQANPWGP